ncbi:MAG: ABC transporter permease, partial [Candidatus Krumholzibacteria bacterium]|nr:ABC transporter permease [Candidatus Krumholzibacteria bacterium]
MNSRAHFVKRFIRRRVAVAGLVLFTTVILCTIMAEFISPAAPEEIDLSIALQPPSIEHPFGTDPFGRDLFSRVLYGARFSLGVGFLARTISLLLGLILGTIAGYFGGRLDSFVMRLADITFAFPTLLLLIAVMAVVSPGLVSLFVTLGVVGWAAVARLVRAQVLSAREREFVQAAKAAGAGHSAVIFKH